MRRLDFITALLGAALCPIAARAQQSKKVARLGFLATGSLGSPEQRPILNAFYKGLREHGYIDNQNVIIEVRAADSKMERFPALANELVGLNLDVIVAANSVAGSEPETETTVVPNPTAASSSTTFDTRPTS